MANQLQPALPQVQLVITFDQATGAVGVTGPIQNRVMCYGLLGMAQEIIAGGAKPANPKSLVAVHGQLNGN